MERFKYLKLNRISRLPKTAGVYCFQDGKKILYIGKAANIKERVKQHKDLLGLAKEIGAKEIGYIKTNSEIEALILEAKLIKKIQPKYNVLWRDDKNYFYAAITKEELPRVLIVRQKKKTPNRRPFHRRNFSKKSPRLSEADFPLLYEQISPQGQLSWVPLETLPGA